MMNNGLPNLILGFDDRSYYAASDHQVLTPKGWVPVETLQVGDTVIDAGGATIKLLHIIPLSPEA